MKHKQPAQVGDVVSVTGLGATAYHGEEGTLGEIVSIVPGAFWPYRVRIGSDADLRTLLMSRSEFKAIGDVR